MAAPLSRRWFTINSSSVESPSTWRACERVGNNGTMSHQQTDLALVRHKDFKVDAAGGGGAARARLVVEETQA
jgi:hypothetical protein